MSISVLVTASISSFPEQAATLGSLLRSPYRKLSVRLYAEMAKIGFPEIRPSHSVVFRHIAPAGSRLTDLAEIAGLTKQSMAYLVGHLAKHGYVKVVTDPVDGRAKLVQLSKRGKSFIETLLKASAQLEDDLGKKIGNSNLQSLRSSLKALDQAISNLP
jgi:DNA-binding MarR family transcriptional regulator